MVVGDIDIEFVAVLRTLDPLRACLGRWRMAESRAGEVMFRSKRYDRRLYNAVVPLTPRLLFQHAVSSHGTSCG